MNDAELFGLHKSNQYSFIAHSHLRWDFVWQRPQQILSRLAKDHPILFVEEPIFHDGGEHPRGFGAAELALSYPHPNVIRVVPRLDAALAADYDAAATRVRDLLQDKLDTSSLLASLFKNRILWFYTPMPAPIMLSELGEVGVVYDCMDELAQFKDAPRDIRKREQFLLKNADVVFTGGRNLYENKSRVHSNVHFFGCGVDIQHFGKARLPETKIAGAVQGFEGPIAGYFGVIDERLDYALIADLAENKPDWNFMLVGPVVKVDPAILPQAPNLHWLGQQDYKDLPNYVKAFDVCLMPFALNDATQYINPTKTLEYMAAKKPILSTAVADVVKNFTPVVQVANSRQEFVRRLEATRALADEILAAGLAMAEAASWESIVEKIKYLVKEAVMAPSAVREKSARPIATAIDSRSAM